MAGIHVELHVELLCNLTCTFGSEVWESNKTLAHSLVESERCCRSVRCLSGKAGTNHVRCSDGSAHLSGWVVYAMAAS